MIILLMMILIMMMRLLLMLLTMISVLSVLDNWWQTETGGMMISARSGDFSKKAGAVGKPLKGIQAALVDEKGGGFMARAMGYCVWSHHGQVKCEAFMAIISGF